MAGDVGKRGIIRRGLRDQEKEKGVGVAQWQSACPACTRTWVPIPLLKNKNE